MLIRRRPEILPSAITPPEVYGGRREFLRAAALGAAACGLELSTRKMRQKRNPRRRWPRWFSVWNVISNAP